MSKSKQSNPARKIRKVLIANRGEIAVRVLRALREQGIRGAVVYSDADRTGLPVLLADEAYRIGPAPSNESYLRAEAIADLAVEIGADAIHPGYGFLSENADFAEICAKRGVIFIGPTPEAMRVMGSKIASRRRMIEAGVPVVPGGQDPLASLEDAESAAAEIGYPVMLKASAGGGGKGMRRVMKASELASAYRAARSEAMASFGDDQVFVEKYVVNPRHIEIQVLGDNHGKVVSLGERECSLQRRHQKVVEEAPSPVVDRELRRRMGEAAVRAAEAVGYSNAGTVEFLLAKDGEFYFLEMNTRLQVEHPVTEEVTGVDLVRAQLSVARGEALDPKLEGIEPRGHSIEVRLYAEDPQRGFSPSPGRIELLRLPEGPGVRNDCGVYEGSEISIYYDPMIGKLIVWGADRDQAIARLERALSELRVEGIRTTRSLFLEILADEDFRAGRLDIALLDRKIADGVWAALPNGEGNERDLPIVAAAIAHYERQQSVTTQPTTSSGRRLGWSQAARSESLRRQVQVERVSGGYRVVVGDNTYDIDATVARGELRSLLHEGQHHEGAGSQVELMDPLTHLALASHAAAGGSGGQVVEAYMPGRVVKVLVEQGQEVEAGQGLVVLEAMKMENEIQAEIAGAVTKLLVEEGQAVEGGDPMLEIG
nr:biotin carboxylase 1-like [Nerophis lumbriciformis]